MVDLRDDKFELNEVNWWSNWANVKWTSKNSYVILSEEFDEPFFNRGGFVKPEDASAVARLESAFRRKRREPYILLQKLRKYSEVEKTLDGYEVIDGMSVMELRTPSFRPSSEVRVEVINGDNARDWCEAYLIAFYGGTKLMTPVERIVRRIVRGKGATLLLARYRGSAAGTAAIYSRGGLTGAYCVGTRPEFRNRGIATTLLESVYSDSKGEGNRIILQTMISDEAEGLYRRLGFDRVYLKQLFKKTS